MLNSKAPEQMTAECWHWHPRWNRLASSTSCFSSSACLQSSSSVLCKTAYSLESPQDRLGGTHAEGAGHPDKLTLNGEKYTVSVNEFSAMCSWQVVGVQVEQNRCKDRALKKAVTLASPSTGVIAHVHPETSISKQQTHQSGEPIWHAFCSFLKKTSVSDSAVCCC